MKTFLVHHTPKSASQDTWAVSFSLPYIAREYVRAGDGLWYVRTWLTAEQIKRRLAILFDDQDELHVHELGREEASLNGKLTWMPGRLEDEEPVEFLSAPRFMWSVLQSAVQSITGGGSVIPSATVITAATLRNSRAA
jgi:hypothetical protein